MFKTASEFNQEIKINSPVIFIDDAGNKISTTTKTVAKISRERGPVVAVACRSGYVSIKQIEIKN